MKNCYLLLLASLLCTASVAQDWIPILENERHHFQFSDSSSITNTIYIDSVTTQGEEIFYHLNRVVALCDTCTYDFIIPYATNEGQFLQQRMVRQADGGFRFEGADNFVLYPQLPEGSSWMFETTTNVEATISSVAETTIFGELDSTKTISLSDGRSMICSKAHGLLAFPDSAATSYELVGLEVADLGEQVPDHWDFFDFNVGDVFQYFSRSSLNPGKPHFIETVEKLTVLEKTILPQGYQYSMRRVGYEGRYEGFYFEFPFEDTIQVDYFYKETDCFNRYPGEVGTVVQAPWLVCYDTPDMERAQGEVFYYIDTADQLRTKTLGERYEFATLFCHDEENPTIGDREYIVDQYHEVYKEGLGLVDYGYFIFEVWGNRRLEGYVKNGDTVGVVTSDIILDTDRPFEPSLQLTLAPNPVANSLFVDFQVPLPDEGQLIIWSMNGQALLRQVVSTGQPRVELDVSFLPKGTYSLQLMVEGRIDVERFVKF
ncbi:MAG: T9SS type A sorting domain-containing protein [Bacteroidota bacterium]